MKNILYVIGVCAISLLMACGDDESGNRADLFYDNGVNSAPFFDQGTYEAAARFPRSLTGNFTNKKLDNIEFYLLNTPNTCRIKVYDEGTSSTPGALLYEADVTNSSVANSWNNHVLTESVNITGNDLWISIQIGHSDTRNTIGCDVGPANENGDWVFEEASLQWQSYRDFTADQVNINWNIRASVTD